MLVTAKEAIAGLSFIVNPSRKEAEIVQRHVALLITLLAALLCATITLTFLNGAHAQNTSASNSSTPVQPNAGSIIGGPNATLPARLPELQCQGCHGPGRQLPYLAGSLFHNEPHKGYDHSFHAQAKQNGAKAAACLDCHTKNGDMTTILPPSDPKSTINRANIAETCGRCHGDKSVMQGSGISNQPILAYRESVHAKAIARGNMSAAVCTDCHNAHDIEPAANQQSTIARVNIPNTCGNCHATESREFLQSIHGQAIVRGVSRAPVCTDCHGIHNILQPFDGTKETIKPAVGTDSCAKCHEGVTLTTEFGVASGRVSSYKDSYHGLASQLGSKVVANCASCHGVHNILPSSDTRSMINSANLQQTCGQCHVGASENFTKGKIHFASELVSNVSTHDMGARGTRIVRWIYLPLIFLTIAGMVGHNLLIWRKKLIARRREPRSVVRLTANQRVQHWLLLTSFIALVLSGFALQYPDSLLAWLLGSNEFLRRVLHRTAAVIMLVVGVYHLLYLAFSKDGRRWVKDMLPKLKDMRDVVGNFSYYLGINRVKPKIARFGYAEKAEYWAVIWGTFIMGLTGLMIWFKISLFSFLARWWIDIALAIHFYEAVLATLAIIIWHFYHVIFDPDVYPLNFAFIDGRVPEEFYREEHELAFEQMNEPAEPQVPSPGSAADAIPGTAEAAESFAK
ncbi:MAG TPA: cytochrome b/b6 domain-containing protein [Pyrinomonadaceae bacterium]|jgi:formate dehydrogenase gamma subunit|nr:cytochrome b/b6 domain-containing protein [Pyrinomonadaceae bacterium]